MTRLPRALFLLIFTFHLPLILQAQFINLQITIEPELTAEVERSLNFGVLVSNSGLTEVNLGDLNMGVFSIRALRTQNIFLNLDYPRALYNSNPAVNENIPVKLQASVNNTGEDRPFGSHPLPPNGGFVPIFTSSNNNSQDTDIWQIMYVYVYGSIDIGDIPNGEYTGQITLSLDYN